MIFTTVLYVCLFPHCSQSSFLLMFNSSLGEDELFLFNVIIDSVLLSGQLLYCLTL